MDDNKIRALWSSSNLGGPDSLPDKQRAADITKTEAKTFLSSMKPLKVVAMIIGILWVVIGGAIIINLFISYFDKVSPFFLLSATIQLLVTAAAIIIYIKQLVLIRQVNISQPVVTVQQKLAELKMSTLLATRILFLQLPVWTTFYLTEEMMENGTPLFFVLQGLATVSFTCLAVWLFVNIKYENKDKKWFKLILGGKEWIPIMKAMELYKNIEEFKEEY